METRPNLKKTESDTNLYKLHLAARREAHKDDSSFFHFFSYVIGRKDKSTKPDTPRSQTWGNPSSDLEAQAFDSPITHAQTAPQQQGTGIVGHGEGGSGLGLNSDADVHDTERSQPDSGETALESQQYATTASPPLRPQDAVRRRTTTREESDPEPNEPEEGVFERPKKQKSGLFKRVQPKRRYSYVTEFRKAFGTWLNILLIMVPAGFIVNYVNTGSKIAVFVVNFIAIIPLAALLSFATEEIALRTGESLGGLLNATFGNAVELIVAIIALAKKEVVIVQTSLIGSILSNLLLVMGMCFFFGGLRRQEQFFNTTVAQTAASLLALAVAAVIVPTVFNQAANTPTADVAKLSRGTAVILLAVYAAYLFFQLKTHAVVFATESQKVEAKPFKKSGLKEGAVAQALVGPAGVMGSHALQQTPTDQEKLRDTLTTPPTTEGTNEANTADDGEGPHLFFSTAIGLLLGSTVLVAFCAEFMVDGISAVTEGGAVSQEFVGLILLPIVGNAAEHATAVTVAIKDKMDLAIGVAVGSSMQVALFLIPLLVIIGWGMGLDEMNLSFDLFQVAVLFVSILLVNYLIADGKSHWLEGMLLMSLYLIIATCSWWYPTQEGLSE
ncbi:Sodium/calcium exchanger protein-domain-containing protein [Bombardia bombarda]|uniref:Sodium/calcium exchanger protein-domain-containing protein n=1 Tax=Bombardia bombarda TaxID=252184 RepID=A0AA39XAE8_9PEZI|nr:Sodium/calcium exchanger protein-domain-containing protein [Bombardia bombarda]